MTANAGNSQAIGEQLSKVCERLDGAIASMQSAVATGTRVINNTEALQPVAPFLTARLTSASHTLTASMRGPRDLFNHMLDCIRCPGEMRAHADRWRQIIPLAQEIADTFEPSAIVKRLGSGWNDDASFAYANVAGPGQHGVAEWMAAKALRISEELSRLAKEGDDYLTYMFIAGGVLLAAEAVGVFLIAGGATAPEGIAVILAGIAAFWVTYYTVNNHFDDEQDVAASRLEAIYADNAMFTGPGNSWPDPVVPDWHDETPDDNDPPAYRFPTK